MRPPKSMRRFGTSTQARIFHKLLRRLGLFLRAILRAGGINREDGRFAGNSREPF